MIKITLTNSYKSLSTINQTLEFPDFTIISGINGAGKSHLLQAIQQNIAQSYNEFNELLAPIRYSTVQSLAPNESISVGRESLTYVFSNLYSNIQAFIQSKRQNNLHLEFFQMYGTEAHDILKKVCEDSGKNLEELSVEDISEFYPISSNFGLTNDIFYQNFSTLFKRYADRYDDNLYKHYLKEVKGKKVRSLTEETFKKKHGIPPWEIVNEIFESANIDYTINDPIDLDRDLPFTFKLVNKVNGAQVNFNDLSSGEKVLMSLVLALYNSKFDIIFPKLLLLDEPDAPLHPSMTKQLLDVIQQVFVKDKGVKVIMTTHSPSTVALAPDESLFVMQKDEPRLKKASKDQLLKLLTAGIPSFSVNFSNNRQVFVESDVDAQFYTKIYNKLKSKIPNDISLYFIPSGIGRNTSGNCDQVKEIVNKLVPMGATSIFGIIDWDLKNNSNEHVKVLGHEKRYSIENYVFDPLILSAYLLREKVKDRNYFGLSEDENYFDFRNFDSKRLQKIVDSLMDTIKPLISIDNESMMTVYYQNQISINIPIWFLRFKGHDLEEQIKEVYPTLKKFKANELKMDIVNRVIDDLPEFIPTDIVDLFQSIQNS
jgi:ABC-type cobalamin/Fe3+-siderophores transport system ATPase subunit